jgi:mannose-6-phosphate isomerase-like protein (cupin superfamily)
MTETWRSVSRLERADFYSDWLAASERNAVVVERSPILAKGRDLTWIETPNEHRIAMLIGEQVGFPTNGTNLCRVGVPVGHHTGRHRHGEEAIHVLTGSGAILVGGRRYDVRPGTTVHVPYNEDHQVWNLGDEELSYVSASTIDLDLFVRLGRLEQIEEKGANDPAAVASLPAEDGQFDRLGRRVALHLDDAPLEAEKHRSSQAKHEGEKHRSSHGSHEGHGEHKKHSHDDGGATADGAAAAGSAAATAAPARLIKSVAAHRHGAIFNLMGGGESASEVRNGFTAISVAMTQIFEEVPHSSSHDHSHTEAVLFVLEGIGFSEIDGEHYDWEAGDAVQIPPKMTRHEHFNPSDGRTRTLRIEYGIRYFYEQLWPGYFKVEHRETSLARPVEG